MPRELEPFTRRLLMEKTPNEKRLGTLGAKIATS
jgi:hypothetical protein